LQKKLAEEVTCLVHSRSEYEFALKASGILFESDTAGILKQLNEQQLLQVMEGVPAVEFSMDRLRGGVDLISFLAETGIFPSKGEARKMLLGGGVSVNKLKDRQ
jgi:tyrosyl-tRNA synthetase